MIQNLRCIQVILRQCFCSEFYGFCSPPSQRLKHACQAHPKWGPALQEHRTGRYAPMVSEDTVEGRPSKEKEELKEEQKEGEKERKDEISLTIQGSNGSTNTHNNPSAQTPPVSISATGHGLCSPLHPPRSLPPFSSPFTPSSPHFPTLWGRSHSLETFTYCKGLLYLS